MFSMVILIAFFSCVTLSDNDLIPKSEFTEKYIEENMEVFFEDDASSAIEIVSRDGCTIRFEPGSFLQDGSQYNGEIKIEFLIIHDQIDMILSGMHTMYADWDSNYSLMESGGEFLLKAFDENNEELRLSEFFEIYVPKSLTEPTDSLMRLYVMFEGENNGSLDANFWSTFGSPDNDEYFSNTEDGYFVYFRHFEWINCDDLIDFEGPAHKLDFTYPNDYDSSNSFAFITLNNYPNSLATTDLYIPENEEGHLVFIARDNEHFHLIVEPFTSIPNLEIDLRNLDVVKVPNAEVDNYLANILN